MSVLGGDPTMSLSYIVPAHNSASVIEKSLAALGVRLAGTNAEILVIENGSSDNTLELLRRTEAQWRHDVQLRVLSTDRGLGVALRAGITASTGARLVISADDLPFGFDDLDAAQRLDPVANPVVVGSKAHPDSITPRSLRRRVLTLGFLALRRLILGMRTRDPQGSFVLNGPWAREVCPLLREPGFLLTTELTYIAERSGLPVLEVPVRLRAEHDRHASRIRLSDPVKMGIGLFALRRHSDARVPLPENAHAPDPTLREAG